MKGIFDVATGQYLPGGAASDDWGGKKPPIEPPPSSGHSPDMDAIRALTERMVRVEAAIDGLKHSQNLTIGAMAGGFALILAVTLAFGIYTLQRIDKLPDDFKGIADSIMATVTATRAAAPPPTASPNIIINVPPLAPPPPQQQP